MSSFQFHHDIPLFCPAVIRSFLLFSFICLSAIRCASAAVIYSGLQDIPITVTFEGVYLDVDTGAIGGSEFSGWDINPFFGGQGIANSPLFQPIRTGTDYLDPYRNMTFGELIDAAASSYSLGEGGTDTSHLGAGSNQFHEAVDGYLGFQFTTNSSAGPFFGWMRLNLTPGTSTGLIRDWAYDNTGSPVFAGMTISAPEPCRMMLFLAGLLAMMARRSRSPKFRALN